MGGRAGLFATRPLGVKAFFIAGAVTVVFLALVEMQVQVRVRRFPRALSTLRLVRLRRMLNVLVRIGMGEVVGEARMTRIWYVLRNERGSLNDVLVR